MIVEDIEAANALQKEILKKEKALGLVKSSSVTQVVCRTTYDLNTGISRQLGSVIHVLLVGELTAEIECMEEELREML